MGFSEHEHAATGDCYEAAAKLATSFLGSAVEAKLVHADVTGQGEVEGLTFGHAWVEVSGNVAFDCSNGKRVAMRAELYRLIGCARNVREYTPEQATKMMAEHGHYGPWEDDDE